MLKHMEEFEAFGIPYYTHYTINDYHTSYEKHLNPMSFRTQTFKALAMRGSPVMWRYDPIIVSEEFSLQKHLDTFKNIAIMLEGSTNTCHISFMDEYLKTRINMAELPKEQHAIALPLDLQETMARRMWRIGREHGIDVVSCAEEQINPSVGCKAGACIDPAVIHRLSGAKVSPAQNNRSGCNCVQHRDIGAYNTCPTGCTYCYAVTDRAESSKFMKHEYDVDRSSLKVIPIREVAK